MRESLVLPINEKLQRSQANILKRIRNRFFRKKVVISLLSILAAVILLIGAYSYMTLHQTVIPYDGEIVSVRELNGEVYASCTICRLHSIVGRDRWRAERGGRCVFLSDAVVCLCRAAPAVPGRCDRAHLCPRQDRWTGRASRHGALWRLRLSEADLGRMADRIRRNRCRHGLCVEKNIIMFTDERQNLPTLVLLGVIFN